MNTTIDYQLHITDPEQLAALAYDASGGCHNDFERLSTEQIEAFIASAVDAFVGLAEADYRTWRDDHPHSCPGCGHRNSWDGKGGSETHCNPRSL